MKKRFLVGLLLIAALTMTGCNASGQLDVDAGNSDEASQDAEEDNKASETASEENKENDDVQSMSGIFLELSRQEEYYWSEVMNAEYSYLELDAPEYPELQASFDVFMDEVVNSAQAFVVDTENVAQQEIDEWGEEQFMGPYGYQSDYYVKRSDNQVLSLQESYYLYTGGAHGHSDFTSVNFDVQTGEQLELTDVVTDVTLLPEALADEILIKYPDITYFTDTLEDTFQEYITPSDPDLYAPEFTWTLGYEGITFYFGSYEIGSYADGLQTVTLLYSEYPDIIKSDYFTTDVTNYALLIDSLGFTEVDLNADGSTDEIKLVGYWDDDGYAIEELELRIGGVNADNIFCHCYDYEVYYAEKDGNPYVYIETTSENDSKTVYCYSLKDGVANRVGEFYSDIETFTNTEKFTMLTHVDMLSTYDVRGDYCIGENGMPVALSDSYEVMWEVSIVSTVDITADLVDMNGNLLGESRTFPAGTSFTFYKTDMATYVDMHTNEGNFCRLYTSPEWDAEVNGLNPTESFEMLMYAG